MGAEVEYSMTSVEAHPRGQSAQLGPWLRNKEAAKKCGVCVKTLRRFAETKPGFPQPARVSARVVLWPAADLDAWLRSSAA